MLNLRMQSFLFRIISVPGFLTGLIVFYLSFALCAGRTESTAYGVLGGAAAVGVVALGTLIVCFLNSESRIYREHVHILGLRLAYAHGKGDDVLFRAGSIGNGDLCLRWRPQPGRMFACWYHFEYKGVQLTGVGPWWKNLYVILNERVRADSEAAAERHRADMEVLSGYDA